jgi:hypothetical protein
MSFKDHKGGDDDEDSIIDEVEEDSMNKRESTSGDQIPESLPYDESAAASAKLTKLRQELGSEEAIRQQSKNTVMGKVQKLTGGPFNKHSFNDMQEEKFKQLMQSEGGSQDSIIKNVERQIEVYKAQAHRDLEA